MLAIPLGVKNRSFWPLAVLGSAGSIADLAQGYQNTIPLRTRLEALTRPPTPPGLE